MVVLDTNILIDHLRQLERRMSLFSKITSLLPGETFAISIITVQELYAGKSSASRQAAREIEKIISALQLLPYDYKTAKRAGRVARDMQGKVKFADATIAATTIENKATLYTLNRKHFVS